MGSETGFKNLGMCHTCPGVKSPDSETRLPGFKSYQALSSLCNRGKSVLSLGRFLTCGSEDVTS